MKRKVRDALGLLEPLGLAPPRIHPDYVPPRNTTLSKTWKAKFRALKRFAKTEGHAKVPVGYGTATQPRLGQWVHRQRHAFRNERFRKASGLAVGKSRMTDEQEALLRSVGFEWEVLCAQALRRWRDKFALLHRFFRKHQHSRAPLALDTKEYPRLGAWVQQQRKAYRREQQRLAGQEVGPGCRLSSKWKLAKLRSVAFDFDAKASVWQEKFAMLKEFELWEGHTRVPRSLDTDRHPKLGKWVDRQRCAYRNEQCLLKGQQSLGRGRSRISGAQIAQLEELGFEWEVRGKPIPKVDLSQFEGMII